MNDRLGYWDGWDGALRELASMFRERAQGLMLLRSQKCRHKAEELIEMATMIEEAIA